MLYDIYLPLVQMSVIGKPTHVTSEKLQLHAHLGAFDLWPVSSVETRNSPMLVADGYAKHWFGLLVQEDVCPRPFSDKEYHTKYL